MTELEKIAYAKSFIDKLANGINPIDDQPVAEYDVVNNVRLNGMNGEYQVVVYNKEAQAFILDNIDAIIASENK